MLSLRQRFATMKFPRFFCALIVALIFCSPGVSVGQNTVTDQFGTTIMTDYLPPKVQSQVSRPQSVPSAQPLRSGGRGRVGQNPDYTSINLGGPDPEEELLVNQLLGVVLVPSPGDVRPEGWRGVEGVWHDFRDFPPEVGWALQKYIGKPVSLNSLDRMVKDVVIAYREGDRPVVDVLLPEQDITSGVVQLVVIESKLARVRVEGVDVETEEYIRSQMRVRKGEVIRASQVLHDLAWINRSPYRKVDLAYAPGFEFGTTDIILQPYSTDPTSWFIGYEDSGTEFLGIDRLIAGFTFGEFGRPGRSLSYQFTSDLDFEHVLGHTVVYSHDLPWRHNLTFLASFVDIETAIPLGGGLPDLGSEGFNWQLSLRYNIPLKQKEWDMCPPLFGEITRRRNLDFGFDFKTNENNLEFGGFPGLLPGVLGSTVEIYQFSIGYNESWQHPEGVSQFDIRGIYSPGGFSPHNSDAVFATSRALSDSTYGYITAGFEHQHQLINNWTMRGKIAGQVATDNLQASEQLGVGGFDIVRGYDQRIIRGDEGIWGTLELYTPELSIGRFVRSRSDYRAHMKAVDPYYGPSEVPGLFDWKYSRDTLRFLAFIDAAAVGNEDLLPGELESQTIASTGLGLRWEYNDFFRVRVDYGYPVKTETAFPVSTTGRFHIGATATF